MFATYANIDERIEIALCWQVTAEIAFVFSEHGWSSRVFYLNTAVLIVGKKQVPEKNSRYLQGISFGDMH